MPSDTGDSHRFLKDAADNGAVAAIVHSDEGYDLALSLSLAAAQLDPARFQDSIWHLALTAFGDPGLRMKLIGITGTNGKTTTAWIVRDLLNALGVPCGYLGTLGFQTPTFARELANTTPFPIELFSMLHEAADSGCEAMAIEISSHALAQKRAHGLTFEAVAFTNLSQDHLDFHGSMAEYENAKRLLFTEFESKSKVINLGDEAGRKLVNLATHTFVVTSEGPNDQTSQPANHVDAQPVNVELTKLRVAVEGTEFEANLGGDYNVENTVTAYTIVRAASNLARGGQGFSPAQVCEAMKSVRPVPGRFEPVPNAQGIGIIVDYAHTPDALITLLETARPLVSGRIITVFGCGGDRDKTKRPLMAQAASEGSNFVIATSDNPRTEDPLAILKDVERGLSGAYEIIPDRPAAIARAIALAQPGDAVMIAGKGHENYQIIGREKFPMDDRVLAKNAAIT